MKTPRLAGRCGASGGFWRPLQICKGSAALGIGAALELGIEDSQKAFFLLYKVRARNKDVRM